MRQDYTGYLKDEESGLEFAEARYYNPLHGRFTSVDRLTASATVRNPQTFNRYAYALNSPYKFTDPLGLEPIPYRYGAPPGAYGCGAENSSCSDGWNDVGGFLEPGPKGMSDPGSNKKESVEPVPAAPAASGGSQQQAEQPTPPPAAASVVSDAKIELIGIQIVTAVPKIDEDGNEDMSTTTVLANGEPYGPFGAELNVVGAAEQLRRGDGVWVRITLTIEGDKRVSFAPVDETQSGTAPVLVGSGQEKTLARGVTTKPITRLLGDNRTVVAYVAIERSNNSLSDLPRSIAVQATAFYRDAFSTGRKPGEFTINQPNKITKSIRIRLYNKSGDSVR